MNIHVILQNGIIVGSGLTEVEAWHAAQPFAKGHVYMEVKSEQCFKLMKKFLLDCGCIHKKGSVVL